MSQQQIIDIQKPATIKDILSKLRKPNLAEDIDEEILSLIATQVVDHYVADKESMDGWTEFIERGQQLSIQEMHGKPEPWENSANFKSPVLLNAALKFGDRASATLLRQKDIVRMDVIGKDTDGAKKERAERVAVHMNYQINYSIPEWREDQDRLLYCLGQEGTVFKRSFFDASKGRNVSEIIRPGSFAVNQNNSHIDEARSFTIIRRFDQNAVLEKQREGIWLDLPIIIESKPPTEPVEDEDDDPNPGEIFYEQDMFYDLDEDGYAEPYIATVHKITNQVVRLIARYDEDGIFVVDDAGVVTTVGRIIEPLGDETGLTFDEMTLVRIEPETMTTKYGFIPAIDGTFLNIGYFHLLAAITQAINSSTNHMINAGFLQTIKTTFLAKGFRKKMGNMLMKIGMMNKTDLSADQLQNGVKVMDFGEPSQVLLALTQEMKTQAEQLSGSADISEAVGANAPATTMLGLVQEQLVPMAALIMRVYRAEKEEFKKLFVLNSKFTDPLEYEFVLDEEEELDFRADYDSRMMDVMPAANPEMTSKVQKLIQSQIQMEQFDRVLQAGGNPIPILMDFFEVIGADRIDEIFPPPEDGEEDEQLKMLREQQALQGKIATGQLEVLQDQVEISQARTIIDKQKADDKSRDTTATIEKIKAEIILTREQAETEDAKNQTNVYTQGIDRALKLLELAIDKENNDRQLNLRSGNQAQ